MHETAQRLVNHKGKYTMDQYLCGLLARITSISVALEMSFGLDLMTAFIKCSLGVWR
jgi:hypothetical protein